MATEVLFSLGTYILSLAVCIVLVHIAALKHLECQYSVLTHSKPEYYTMFQMSLRYLLYVGRCGT